MYMVLAGSLAWVLWCAPTPHFPISSRAPPARSLGCPGAFSTPMEGTAGPAAFPLKAIRDATRARVSPGLGLAPALVLGPGSLVLLSGLTSTVTLFTLLCFF